MTVDIVPTPANVVIWSTLGGVVSVLIRARNCQTFNVRWGLESVSQLVVSTMPGIACSAILQTVASNWLLTKPFAEVPRWGTAFAVAALLYEITPITVAILGRQVRGLYGNMPTITGAEPGGPTAVMALRRSPAHSFDRWSGRQTRIRHCIRRLQRCIRVFPPYVRVVSPRMSIRWSSTRRRPHRLSRDARSLTASGTRSSRAWVPETSIQRC
jgi:hypothetical protein